MKNKKFYVNPKWLLLLILIDRAVKMYITANYRVGEVFGELPFVADFVYVQNTGAAFSIFSNQTAFLGILSVVFCAALLVYWKIKKPEHELLKTAMVLLFSGALGNAVDRVFLGFVVDFISIKWFNFPVFNIADMAIVIGAILLVIYVIFFEDKEKKKDE